jgi:Rap1a immunity proteins
MSFASPAEAEMDAQTFLQNYDRGSLQDRQLYERILGSAENGISWANAAVGKEHGFHLYCPPDIALADQQDVVIIRQYLSKHPDHRTYPYGLVLLVALEETFPCK